MGTVAIGPPGGLTTRRGRGAAAMGPMMQEVTAFSPNLPGTTSELSREPSLVAGMCVHHAKTEREQSIIMTTHAQGGLKLSKR